MKKVTALLVVLLVASVLLFAAGTAEQAQGPKVMKIAGTMSQAETDGEYQELRKFARLVELYTMVRKCQIPLGQLGVLMNYRGSHMEPSKLCCGASAMQTVDPFLSFLEMPTCLRS